MSSSQAYLGAFETTDAVTVKVDKTVIELILSAYDEKDVVISWNQWEKIWKEIYESDLVADFIGGVIEIAESLVYEKEDK